MKMFFAFLCVILFNNSYCQKDVTLSGTFSKFSSGKVYLIPIVNDSKYYSNYEESSSTVINGSFSIHRKIYDSLPQAYYLMFTNDSISLETGMLVLESKEQTVFVDSFDIYIYPRIAGSKFQDELIFQYATLFEPVIKKANQFSSDFDRIYLKYNNEEPPVDTLSKMYYKKELITKEGDSLFTFYINKHKDSYISIWKLIDRIKLFGYKPRYEGDFNNLEKSIRESKLGETLQEEMKQLKVLSTGNIFPEMNLQTLFKESSIFNIKTYKGKLVLIEFWFHNCGPCIAQFNSLNSIYKKYKKENFEIVAISIDKSEDLKNLKSVVSQKNYPWLNIWDENGKYATTYLLHRYPTNFLVNENGEIIEVNIPPFLVEQYISEFKYKKVYFFDQQ